MATQAGSLARPHRRPSPLPAVLLRRPDLPNSLALGWAVLVAALLFWRFSAYGFDDPYITYRYADNLAHGLGFVYNSGERVLSTTTPLYTLILALLRLAGADLPLASNALGCITIAIGGWALWALARAWEAPVAGAAGLVLYSTFPLLMPTLGAETTFYVALILLGILAYERERPFAAAIVLALAALTRADGVLVAGVVALDCLLRRRRPVPWRAVGAYLLLVAAWFAFAWVYFGQPFPVTLAVKQHQGQLAVSQSFARGFVQMLGAYWSRPLYRLHFVLAGLGLGYALARRPRFLLLLAWDLCYFVAYVALGVTRYYWYYAPLAPGIVALVSLGVAATGEAIGRATGPRYSAAVAALLALPLLAAQLSTLDAQRKTTDARLEIYHTVGDWLRTSTPQEASVGTLEVGIIGYYAQRRMIDFAGLIQPETALQLTKETTYEDAAIWAVHHFRPDYLILRDGLFTRLERDPAVARSCRRVKTWSDAADPSVVVAYRCGSR